MLFFFAVLAKPFWMPCVPLSGTPEEEEAAILRAEKLERTVTSVIQRHSAKYSSLVMDLMSLLHRGTNEDILKYLSFRECQPDL